MRTREKWQLSLRPSNEFEGWLLGALRAVPKGYGKVFLCRAARLFAHQATSQDDLERIIREFVDNVQPLCLEAMPDVRMSPRSAMPGHQPALPGTAARPAAEDHLGC